VSDSDALERELRIGAQASHRLMRALDEAADALRQIRISGSKGCNEEAVTPVPKTKEAGPEALADLFD